MPVLWAGITFCNWNTSKQRRVKAFATRVKAKGRKCGIQGSSEAINAVGGVTELARRIGISQPSVSNWDRVPAERVLPSRQQPALRGCACARIFTREAAWQGVDEIDPRARAGIRAARRAAGACAGRRSAAAAGAACAATGRRSGCAPWRSAERPHARCAREFEREYFDLFIGLGRGELLPYGSYYLTGFLHERPLARLRDDLARSASSGSKDNYEPEDHAATFARSWRRRRRTVSPRRQSADRKLFEKHMAPWMGRLFADLERARRRISTARVGALGRAFMDIETEAFALPA